MCQLEGFGRKMDGPPAPPPPPPSADSSAPGFKTNSSNPNPAPAQPTPTLPALDVLLRVITDLHARGYLGGLEIPADVLTEERAPALFCLVVAAYISDTGGRNSSVVYPIPPPPISSGHNVELIRLYQAVQSRGGFQAVVESDSWEAVAMDIGLDASARPEIELMYGDYIAPWEIVIRDTQVDQEMVHVIDNAGQSLIEPKEEDEIVPVTIDPPPPPNPSAGQLKRKRGALVGTLNWLRMVAKSPDEPGLLKANSWGHVSRAVRLRRQMCANIDCRPLMTSWKTLTGTLDWVRNVATGPGEEEGVAGEDFGKYFATAVQVRRRMFASDEEVNHRLSVLTFSCIAALYIVELCLYACVHFRS